MKTLRFAAALAAACLILPAPLIAAAPPGANGPVTPVVIKQYSNGAPISADEPLAVNCVTGCGGGGGEGGSDAVTQNSNTSGQSGVLVQGAVTTSAPSYTTAKTNPLSLTTAGALRVDGSAVTQPVSDAGGSLTVDGTVAVSGSVAVTGTFWQATQPVSGTVTVTDGSGAVTVDGTVAATQSGTWNVTNISGTVSLPTGAATAAKQPALGTAGTPSTDVLTVQGHASMTALKVDGSAVTQPVSDAGGSLTVDGTVAATQSGAWNVTNISGTVSLPTGAATAANQATEISSLATIATNTGAATPAGENHIGQIGGTTTNPSTVLTRPANTTAYAQNDVISSNTTAGSVVVPSFTAARVTGGSGLIVRARLITNVTTGWDSVTVRVRFWTAAPTFTNGDNGAYAVATGAAGYLGKMDITLEQLGDGAVGVGSPATGTAIAFDLASGTVIYWDLQITYASGATPISGQTFTLIPEILQD